MLRDRIFESPIAFATGCAAWIPLAIWILALVRWLVNGDVDLIFGVLGIGVALFLGFVAMAPPSPQYSIYVFFGILGTVVMFPFVREAVGRRSMKKFEVEDLQKAYDAYGARPDNMVAKFRIARLLYGLGYPGHAIRIAEACLRQMPQAFYAEEIREFSKWQKVYVPPKAFEPISCVECGQANVAGNVHCAACGSPFLLERVRGKMLPRALGKKLLAAWIVMVAALVGLPFVASLGGIAAALGIFALMALAVAVLVLAFWERDKGVAS